MKNSYVSNKRFGVRVVDVDPYRVVHHATYMIWLEESWNNHIELMMKRNLISNSTLKFTNYNVLNIDCRYINSISLKGSVCVYTTIKSMLIEEQKVFVDFYQWIIDEKNKKKLLASLSKICFYNSMLEKDE